MMFYTMAGSKCQVLIPQDGRMNECPLPTPKAIDVVNQLKVPPSPMEGKHPSESDPFFLVSYVDDPKLPFIRPFVYYLGYLAAIIPSVYIPRCWGQVCCLPWSHRTWLATQFRSALYSLWEPSLHTLVSRVP